LLLLHPIKAFRENAYHHRFKIVNGSGPGFGVFLMRFTESTPEFT